MFPTQLEVARQCVPCEDFSDQDFQSLKQDFEVYSTDCSDDISQDL